MLHTVAVLYNQDKPEAKRAFSPLVRWLKSHKVQVLTHSNDNKLSRAKFAIALGGDGTILRVAKILAPLGVPILGINLGRLGFLAETDLKNLYPTLKMALKSELKVQDRLMLDITISKNRKKPYMRSLAFNDCYLHAGSSNRIVEIEAYINGKFLANYTGDGLILSTPTGSTAYSLAASGPIVSPDLPVILLTPICPHTLAQRPLVVSSKDEIELVLKDCGSSSHIIFSLDGQESIKIHKKDRILVETSKHRVKLLVDPKRNYYEILRTKLKWGER